MPRIRIRRVLAPAPALTEEAEKPVHGYDPEGYQQAIVESGYLLPSQPSRHASRMERNRAALLGEAARLPTPAEQTIRGMAGVSRATPTMDPQGTTIYASFWDLPDGTSFKYLPTGQWYRKQTARYAVHARSPMLRLDFVQTRTTTLVSIPRDRWSRLGITAYQLPDDVVLADGFDEEDFL